MDLARIALQRAQEQLDGGGWRVDDPPDPKIVPRPNYDGRRCLRCGEKQLTARNRSNLCRYCYVRATINQRIEYSFGRLPRLLPRRAWARASRRTIERARARLAARGIHVEAA